MLMIIFYFPGRISRWKRWDDESKGSGLDAYMPLWSCISSVWKGQRWSWLVAGRHGIPQPPGIVIFNLPAALGVRTSACSNYSRPWKAPGKVAGSIHHCSWSFQGAISCYTTQTDHFRHSRNLVSHTSFNVWSFCLLAQLCVTAPTGVAAFNVDGYTLHSLLRLSVKGDFKQLKGNQLQTIQKSMTNIRYLIIDEMYMVGRKMFGQVDRRLRQAFPHRYVFITMQDTLRILLHTQHKLNFIAEPRRCLEDAQSFSLVTGVSFLQSWTFHFHHSVQNWAVWSRKCRLPPLQQGDSFGSGHETGRSGYWAAALPWPSYQIERWMEDWKHLMKQTIAVVGATTPFTEALHLFATASDVAEHNIHKLHASGQPVAMLKPVHNGPGAFKATQGFIWGRETRVCFPPKRKCFPPKPLQSKQFFMILNSYEFCFYIIAG